MSRFCAKCFFAFCCNQRKLCRPTIKGTQIFLRMQSSPPAKRLLLSDKHSSTDIDNVEVIIKDIDDCYMTENHEEKTLSSSKGQTTSTDNILSELPFACSSSLDTSSTTVTDKEKKESSGGKKKKKKCKKDKDNSKPKPFPNHFLALKISNEEIVANIKKLQENILLVENKLKPAIISPATLHLTLCVLRISDEEEAKKACEIVDTCCVKIKEILNGESLHLTFENIGHFRNQVVFVKLKDNEGCKFVRDIAKTVTLCFKDTGFLTEESKDFTAHLTVAKISKSPKLRKLKILPECYKGFESLSFGNESINCLQLLSMNKPKDSEGYYHCVKETVFVS